MTARRLKAEQLAATLLMLLVILGGSIAVPPVLRAMFELDSPAISGALAVLWGVLWARIIIWSLRRRAELLNLGRTRRGREKATP